MFAVLFVIVNTHIIEPCTQSRDLKHVYQKQDFKLLNLKHKSLSSLLNYSESTRTFLEKVFNIEIYKENRMFLLQVPQMLLFTTS